MAKSRTTTKKTFKVVEKWTNENGAVMSSEKTVEKTKKVEKFEQEEGSSNQIFKWLPGFASNLLAGMIATGLFNSIHYYASNLLV